MQPDGLHRRVALTNFPKQRDIYKKNSGKARRRREKWSSNVLHFLNGLCPLFRQWWRRRRRRCWWCLLFFMSVVVPSGVIHVRIAGDFARGIVDSRCHQEPTRRNHHWWFHSLCSSDSGNQLVVPLFPLMIRNPTKWARTPKKPRACRGCCSFKRSACWW